MQSEGKIKKVLVLLVVLGAIMPMTGCLSFGREDPRVTITADIASSIAVLGVDCVPDGNKTTVTTTFNNTTTKSVSFKYNFTWVGFFGKQNEMSTDEWFTATIPPISTVGIATSAPSGVKDAKIYVTRIE